MTRILVATALSLSLMAGGGVATVTSRVEGGPDDITGATALAVRNWVTAVRGHTPGRRDAAVAHVTAMSFPVRQKLDPGMTLFLSALKKDVVSTTDAEQRIVDLARQVRLSPGTDAFLKRAAVLHSDAAMLDEPPRSDPVGPAAPSPPGAKGSPLLSARRLLLNKDGEIVGKIAANWNWPFARSLLDLLSQKAGYDPFVGSWYHATTAYMFGQRAFGEAFTHLERAAAVMPDEALLLFDRGCYWELQGMPVIQVLLSEEDLAALRAQRAGRRPTMPIVGHAGELGIPPMEVANDEAERLFRRALRADPSLIEARVRLARLLDLRKRHEEAVAELNTALAAKPTGPVAYHAHLFAGRAAQALGRLDEAVRHYDEAASLFPNAQSARLARSQVALLASDLPAALAAIQRLDARASASTMREDPWWQYHHCAGRDADGLLRELWGSVPR